MSFFDAQDPFDLTGEENAELFSDNIPRDTSFQDILDAELGGEQEDAARERVLFPVHASVKPSNDATPRNGDGEPQENTTQDAAMVDQSNEQIVISSDDESVVVGARTGRTKGRATQSLEGEPDPKKRKLEAPTDTVKEDHMGGMQGHDLPAPQKPAAPEGPQDTQTFVQVAPALPNALPQPLPPTLAQGLPQALLQPAPQAPSQILTQGLPTALPPALPQALPQAAAPAAVLPAGLLLPAIDQSGSDKTKMVWTYERKWVNNFAQHSLFELVTDSPTDTSLTSSSTPPFSFPRTKRTKRNCSAQFSSKSSPNSVSRTASHGRRSVRSSA